ncbi:hypothetical protein M0R04_14775 [Candidatus Dojkabacteria bacterium]|jgi:hypothetical protein|nr:hypothetical protein [Candidatus Dojkabacteria bacterium]
MIDWGTFAIGAIAGGIGTYIGAWLGFKRMKKKRFTNLQKELDEGYAGLKRASQSFKMFNEVVNGA